MQKLNHLSNDQLLSAMVNTRKSEITNSADMLSYLNEVAKRRLHLKLGFSSIYKFLNEKFHYSKDESYSKVRAAQTLAIDPQLENDLRQNRTCVTYLMQAQVAFIKEDKRRKAASEPKLTTQEKQKVLRQIVKNREAKRTIATAFPRQEKDFNRETPAYENTTIYQFALDKEGSEKLKRVKELNSHTVPDGNLSDLINHLLSDYLKKHDKQPTKPMPKTKTENQRKHISVHVDRNLRERANNQCEFQHQGHRCTETFGLQCDHIIPVAHGGTDSPENLRLLCRQHNRYVAEEMGLHRLTH